MNTHNNSILFYCELYFLIKCLNIIKVCDQMIYSYGRERHDHQLQEKKKTGQKKNTERQKEAEEDRGVAGLDIEEELFQGNKDETLLLLCFSLSLSLSLFLCLSFSVIWRPG